MKKLVLIASIAWMAFAQTAQADPTVMEKSVLRGSIVFQTYCVLCHGTKADGNGRMAPLYRSRGLPTPANLTKSSVPKEYLKQMVTKGGMAMKRSRFMPPFGGELSEEQISDVVNYLIIIRG